VRIVGCASASALEELIAGMNSHESDGIGGQDDTIVTFVHHLSLPTPAITLRISK
jgi:hypothetical protein